jgi:hypothetical protein
VHTEPEREALMTTSRMTIGLVVALAAASASSARASGTALCGPNDKPEPALQGQTPLADMASGRSQEPYFCGLRIVGHDDVLNRGANWQLSRIDDCAYLATLKTVMAAPNDPVTTREPSGVAVIDVRNPAAPKVTEILRTPGSVDGGETTSTTRRRTARIRS